MPPAFVMLVPLLQTAVALQVCFLSSFEHPRCQCECFTDKQADASFIGATCLSFDVVESRHTILIESLRNGCEFCHRRNRLSGSLGRDSDETLIEHSFSSSTVDGDHVMARIRTDEPIGFSFVRPDHSELSRSSVSGICARQVTMQNESGRSYDVEPPQCDAGVGLGRAHDPPPFGGLAGRGYASGSSGRATIDGEHSESDVRTAEFVSIPIPADGHSLRTCLYVFRSSASHEPLDVGVARIIVSESLHCDIGHSHVIDDLVDPFDGCMYQAFCEGPNSVEVNYSERVRTRAMPIEPVIAFSVRFGHIKPNRMDVQGYVSTGRPGVSFVVAAVIALVELDTKLPTRLEGIKPNWTVESAVETIAVVSDMEGLTFQQPCMHGHDRAAPSQSISAPCDASHGAYETRRHRHKQTEDTSTLGMTEGKTVSRSRYCRLPSYCFLGTRSALFRYLYSSVFCLIDTCVVRSVFTLCNAVPWLRCTAMEECEKSEDRHRTPRERIGFNVLSAAAEPPEPTVMARPVQKPIDARCGRGPLESGTRGDSCSCGCRPWGLRTACSRGEARGGVSGFRMLDLPRPVYPVQIRGAPARTVAILRDYRRASVHLGPCLVVLPAGRSLQSLSLRTRHASGPVRMEAAPDALLVDRAGNPRPGGRDNSSGSNDAHASVCGFYDRRHIGGLAHDFHDESAVVSSPSSTSAPGTDGSSDGPDVGRTDGASASSNRALSAGSGRDDSDGDSSSGTASSSSGTSSSTSQAHVSRTSAASANSASTASIANGTSPSAGQASVTSASPGASVPSANSSSTASSLNGSSLSARQASVSSCSVGSGLASSGGLFSVTCCKAPDEKGDFVHHKAPDGKGDFVHHSNGHASVASASSSASALSASSFSTASSTNRSGGRAYVSRASASSASSSGTDGSVNGTSPSAGCAGVSSASSSARALSASSPSIASSFNGSCLSARQASVSSASFSASLDTFDSSGASSALTGQAGFGSDNASHGDASRPSTGRACALSARASGLGDNGKPDSQASLNGASAIRADAIRDSTSGVRGLCACFSSSGASSAPASQTSSGSDSTSHDDPSRPSTSSACASSARASACAPSARASGSNGLRGGVGACTSRASKVSRARASSATDALADGANSTCAIRVVADGARIATSGCPDGRLDVDAEQRCSALACR